MEFREGDRYQLTVDGNEYFVRLRLYPDPNAPDDLNRRIWFAVSDPGVIIPGWTINRTDESSAILARIGRNAAIIRDINELGMVRTEELNIDRATDIGNLKLNLKTQFPDGNAISYTDFANGDKLVRLEKNNSFIFKLESLQNWFNSGHSTNPLTGRVVRQADIERFTYIEDPTSGGRMRRSKQRTMRRKSFKNKRNLRKKL